MANALQDSDVQCYYYGRDSTFGNAGRQSPNSAGTGFLIIEVVTPNSGLLQVATPITTVV